MWKECIKGYEISSTGKVKNSETGKLLSIEKNNKGYLRVTIKRKHFFIHKLVAIAFVPNPLNYSQVTFKTADKENVTPTNLVWCYNTYCSTQLFGINKFRGARKVTPGIAMAVKYNKKTSAKDMAKMYDVSLSTIYSLRNK